MKLSNLSALQDLKVRSVMPISIQMEDPPRRDVVWIYLARAPIPDHGDISQNLLEVRDLSLDFVLTSGLTTMANAKRTRSHSLAGYK